MMMMMKMMMMVIKIIALMFPGVSRRLAEGFSLEICEDRVCFERLESLHLHRVLYITTLYLPPKIQWVLS